MKKIIKSDNEEGDERPKYQTSWVWFESLDFLREFVFSKGTKINRISTISNCSTSSTNVEATPVIKMEDDIDNDDPLSEHSESRDDTSRRKRGLAYEGESDESLHKRLRTEETEDGNYHFVMSILPSIRKLPIECQMLVKAKIHDLIYQEYLKSNST